MKRNLTVLVLLVMWLMLSFASLSSAATTGQIPEKQGCPSLSSQQDVVLDVNGTVEDDDPEGDPGDAGDGYGIADQHEFAGLLEAGSGLGDSILDELMFLLMSLVQLAP